MNYSILFEVPGQAIPKERARVVGQRAFTPPRTRAFERLVGILAKQAGGKPVDSRIRLTLRFYCSDVRRRDLSNMLKSIEDGMNGIAYVDDSQIDEASAVRCIDRENPRTVVQVESIDRKETT